MTTLADRIPAMSDADLASLGANATRLMEHGAPNQVIAATELSPLVEAEIARRAAMPKAAKAPRTPAPKKIPPATGHQTALPKTS